jgi:hypothetical protein
MPNRAVSGITSATAQREASEELTIRQTLRRHIYSKGLGGMTIFWRIA